MTGVQSHAVVQQHAHRGPHTASAPWPSRGDAGAPGACPCPPDARVPPQHYLTEIEVLAIIFAAAIHDYEHTGTTNSFHIQTK